MQKNELGQSNLKKFIRRREFAYAWIPMEDKDLVQWEYRDSKGRLYSGLAKDVKAARRNAKKASGEAIPKEEAKDGR